MKVRVGDIEIGYDRAGEGRGDPVLLVMGLSATRIGWIRQMPVLAERHDVTVFDNRGVGETTCPPEPWTVAQMADDAVGLMDALGYERAHVAGISMGGMISQEIALRHPDRVRSLCLISTHPGGPDTAWPSPEVMGALAMADADVETRIRTGVRYTFGKKFTAENPEIVQMAIDYQIANPPPIAGVMQQAAAIMTWAQDGGSASRLGDIAAPTLVLHGTADELIPVENAHLLAKLIPGAELRIYEDAGHALIQERADEVNEELLRHFAG